MLTHENVQEVVERAAFRTKAETDAIAAAVKPRTAPADGVRRLPAERPVAHKIPDRDLAAVLREALRCAIEKHGVRRGMLAPARKKPALKRQPTDCTATQDLLAAPSGASQQNERARSEMGERGQPRSTDEAESSAPISTFGVPPSADRPTIPAEVRRQVWERDGGRCSFVARDGTRCESRWRLELDHVQPWALGGSSNVDDLRLRCRAHNVFHAEEVFGREHMERFRRRATVASVAGGTRDREA